MNFNTLLTVTIQHDFYPPEWGKIFDILPTTECQKQMRRHALMFRPQAKGFKLVYQCEKNSPDLPDRPIDQPVTFDFWLFAHDHPVLSYSDLPVIIKPNLVHCFCNVGKKLKESDNESGLFLKDNNTKSGIKVSSIEWTKSLKEGTRRPFAVVSLQASSDVLKDYNFIDAKQLSAPENALKTIDRDFLVRIKNKSTYWRYHIVPKYTAQNNLQGIKIANDNNGSSHEVLKNIAFKELRGENIKRISPDERTFISKQMIPSSMNGYKNLVLYGNGGSIPLIPNLPNPDGSGISLENGDYYSDIIVYI